MTFRLPCADASVDTRLQVLTHDTDEEDDCALTLASCWEHDDGQFMHSKMQLLANDVFAVATNLMQTESWKKLPSSILRMRQTGCLCVMGCGHKFSGVPLLYALTTVGFKCPICRFGGNATVDIQAPAPVSLCVDTWHVMCTLANVVRKRDKLEKYNEQRMLAIEMSRHSISVVYESMPWFIVFVLYKESKPTMSSTPYAQIPIKMTVELSNRAHSASDPEIIKLSAGVLLCWCGAVLVWCCGAVVLWCFGAAAEINSNTVPIRKCVQGGGVPRRDTCLRRCARVGRFSSR